MILLNLEEYVTVERTPSHCKNGIQSLTLSNFLIQLDQLSETFIPD